MKTLWIAWGVSVLAMSAAADDKSAGLTLRWVTDDPARPALARVEYTLPERSETIPADWTQEQWHALLSVHADQSEMAVDVNLPPMAGTYKLIERALVFTPLFPLQAGVRYRAVVRPSALPMGLPEAKVLTAVHLLEKPVPSPKTFVRGISPEIETLPENTLKFYVHFSAPMSGGGIYQHIRLQKADGQIVPEPFLEIDQEMWNYSMTRLTLFIDPGRIKRGLAPRADLGTVLEQGQKFTLEINATWEDAQEQPLEAAHVKTFLVGPPDSQCPTPSHWVLTVPGSGSRDPLKVRFDEPLDDALALRLIQIISDGKTRVAGKSSVSDQGRQWSFDPQDAWKAGKHHLETPDILEDLAGNSLGRPFEVDIFTSVDPPAQTKSVRLPFQIQ